MEAHGGYSFCGKVPLSSYLDNVSIVFIRVADPGSGAFWTPGFEIQNKFFPDPGSSNK